MSTALSPLSEELARKAKIELSEDPSTVKQAVETLRKSILSDPKMKFRTDDAFLLRFLRARKFNQEQAFQMIKNYYKQRLNYPKFYRNLTASNMCHVLSSNYQGVLHGRDDQGRCILFFNDHSFWNPQTTSLQDITANLLLSLELLIEQSVTQINGIVFIINAKGLTFSHIATCTPSALMHVVSATHNAFPARFKELHFVNQSWIFNFAIAILKPFWSKKVKERLVFHGTNVQALQNYFLPEFLPVDLGGTAELFSNKEWNRQLLEHDEVLKDNMKFGFVSDDH